MAAIAAGEIVLARVEPKKSQVDYIRPAKVMTASRPTSKVFAFRTGNQMFALAHDALLPHSYRVVNSHDLVAHVPPLGLND